MCLSLSNLSRCLNHHPAIVSSAAFSVGFRSIGGNRTKSPTEAAGPGNVLPGLDRLELPEPASWGSPGKHGDHWHHHDPGEAVPEK